MNKAKQFIIESSAYYSDAVNNGMDIRLDEAEIFEWMQKYADSEIKNLSLGVSGLLPSGKDWDKRHISHSIKSDKGRLIAYEAGFKDCCIEMNNRIHEHKRNNR